MTKQEIEEAIYTLKALYGKEEKHTHDTTFSSVEKACDTAIKALETVQKIPELVEELEFKVYRIDDSATLSTRDVVNEEDVFDIIKEKLGVIE